MEDLGYQENRAGTKMLRWVANRIGAASPEREWQFSKELLPECAKLYGRRDWRSVEKAIRDAVTCAGRKTEDWRASITDEAYMLAKIAWDRREELGVPDEEV